MRNIGLSRIRGKLDECGGKLENKVLWIINGSLLLTILCLILILYTKEFLSFPSIFYEPSFIGSITGTIISGAIAVTIMNSQFKQNIKNEETVNLDKELKAIRVFTQTIFNLNNHLSFIYVVGKAEEPRDALSIKRERLLAKQTNEMLKQVKQGDFSHISHELYLKVIYNLMAYQTQIELFEENPQSYKYLNWQEQLSEHRDVVRYGTEEMEELAIEIEKKLNKR
ncbi:hypothetical protein [Sporosarcina sp. FSL K6-1508]|uniref:hypothetical protein n=1 Tax=Sporosarcina sp. FSL K6-1508 TaxID=2921553 RepID=UPI0030F57AF4